MFVAMTRMRAFKRRTFALALVATTLLSILLGAAQVGAADGRHSPLYLYGQASYGQAVGFFANANHFGTLLVATFPFLAALAVAARKSSTQKYLGTVVAIAASAAVVAVGLALNRSGAAQALALPVVAASVLLLFPERRTRSIIALGAIFAVAAAAAAFVMGPPGEALMGTKESVGSRSVMAHTTIAAAKAFAPLGSGLGTFRTAYPLFENPEEVSAIIVNHAHDDYLEAAMELGLPGVLLMILFLLFWVRAGVRVWRGNTGPFARAAVIASGAMLIHSIVDYPLRSNGLAVLFAACLALMLVQPRRRDAKDSELWPTRHVVLE
jgi:O-antigen ligase